MDPDPEVQLMQDEEKTKNEPVVLEPLSTKEKLLVAVLCSAMLILNMSGAVLTIFYPQAERNDLVLINYGSLRAEPIYQLGMIADKSVNCDQAYELGYASANSMTNENFAEVKLKRTKSKSLRAYKKGLSPSEVSYVFSSFYFGTLAFSPLIAIMVTRFGTRLVLNSSMILITIVTPAFAFTDNISNSLNFMVTCIFLRVIQGLAMLGLQTTVFTIVGHKFDGRVGTLTGLMEMCSGLGYMIGNLTGGSLYQGFIRSFIITGLILRGSGFILNAPNILFPIEPKLYLGVLGQISFGLGCVFVYIPLYKYFQELAKSSGFEQNFHTSALIASLLTAIQAFGSTLGPIISGQIVEKGGYYMTYTVFGLLLITSSLIIVADISRTRFSRKFQRKDGERDPLVINS
ncbi:MFS-type transporter SLC18B1 [Nymphon striatum]|nr:MFS-type transporter SLC18B1 [Nymphon striatum]